MEYKMKNIKMEQQNKSNFYQHYYSFSTNEPNHNNTPKIMDIVRKMSAKNSMPTANISQEISHRERSDFMEQKMQQGEQFKQYTDQLEGFMQGTINALYDNHVTAKKHKEKIHTLKRNYKSDQDTIQSLSRKLAAEKEVSKKLTKQFSKLQKQHQKTLLQLDTVEKTLLHISHYMGVCDKKASLQELALDWKHFDKNHKPQINR